MKLCCVPGCSVGYELGIHVALRLLRRSVLLVMLVFDCCPREYPAMWPASSHAVHRFCFPDKEIECAMRGVRRKHRAI